MNRAEHLQWCKDRAIEYLEWEDYEGSISSMLSDLTKRVDTFNSTAIDESMRILLASPPLTEEKIRQWIEGFN